MPVTSHSRQLRHHADMPGSGAGVDGHEAAAKVDWPAETQGSRGGI